MIRSTINPKAETCFVWSFMFFEKVQIGWYKRSAVWFSMNRIPRIMAWLDIRKLTIRIH